MKSIFTVFCLAACASYVAIAAPAPAKKLTAEETYEKRARIGDAEAELAGRPFSRCSLSYLVNLKRVDRISGDTVVIGPYELPISRNRRKEFLQAFTDYLEAGF